MTDIAARAADLRAELERHNTLYYVENRPEISDREFDAMMAELVKLEEQNPELRRSDSPTQRVGGAPVDGFEQVQHDPPMLSLDNTYDEDELKQWTARLARQAPDAEFSYVAELKIDGVSISLRYRDRRIHRGRAIIGDKMLGQGRNKHIVFGLFHLGHGDEGHAPKGFQPKPAI